VALRAATASAVAAASLSGYDGSAGVLVDTNVWVDCIDAASTCHEWAIEQLQARSEKSPLHVNLIIYTELLVPGLTSPHSMRCWTYTTRCAARCPGLARRWRLRHLVSSTLDGSAWPL
jgi:hypothetical protein